MALKLLFPGLLELYRLAAGAAGRGSDRAWAERVAAEHPDAVSLDEGRAGVCLQLEGLGVRAMRLDGLGDRGGTLFELEVPAPLPPAMTLRRESLLLGEPTPAVRVALGPGLSGFVLRAQDGAWAQRALAGRTLLDALVAADRWGSVVLRAGVLRLVCADPVEPRQVGVAAGILVSLGRALAIESTAIWRREGARHGMRLEISGPHAMRLVSPDGVAWLRYQTAGPDDTGAQVLRVQVRGGFPTLLHLTARRPGDQPGGRLGDFILDRGLRAQGGPADLGARLGTDALRGPLLDFLHGPGAPRIQDGALLLRVPGGGRPALLGRLAETRSLASALEAAFR